MNVPFFLSASSHSHSLAGYIHLLLLPCRIIIYIRKLVGHPTNFWHVLRRSGGKHTETYLVTTFVVLIFGICLVGWLVSKKGSSFQNVYCDSRCYRSVNSVPCTIGSSSWVSSYSNMICAANTSHTKVSSPCQEVHGSNVYFQSLTDWLGQMVDRQVRGNNLPLYSLRQTARVVLYKYAWCFALLSAHLSSL